MSVIHRSAVIIRPLPPYLAWAKQDDTTNIAERVFEDLRTAPHVYLLPEYEDAESEREVLEDFWPELFAAMLNCWLTVEQQWPKNRTHQMFSGSTSRCVRWSRICIWMKSWSNSTRAGHAAIPDSRRPDIRIGRAHHRMGGLPALRVIEYGRIPSLELPGGKKIRPVDERDQLIYADADLPASRERRDRDVHG